MKIETLWGWKTHQPMIHMALELFSPKTIIEYGMGIYSTPIFLASDHDELICIENNKEWMHYMLANFTFSKKEALFLEEVEEPEMEFCKAFEIDRYRYYDFYFFYKETREKLNFTSFPNLLFIDHYMCLRSMAINMLGPKFDIIIFHDCHPWEKEKYNYNLSKFQKDYDYYILINNGAWTGLLLKKSLEYDESKMLEVIRPYIDSFCKENKINSAQFSLIKKEL